MSERCWAALDIGSNTVMSLSARGSAGHLIEATELRETTRLGQGVDAHGVLAPEPQNRTLAAIGSQVEQLRSLHPVCTGIAVATSAVRDARNGRDFLSRCAPLAGGLPRLLSGDEEARFTFRGISSDRPRGQALIHIDVGGGSSEVTVGIAGESCLLARSVDLGCVRIGERFGLLDRADAEAADRARQTVRAVLAPVCQQVKSIQNVSATAAILSGGSATTFAAMRLALRAYAAGRVHGWIGDRRELEQSLADLFQMDAAARALLPCVTTARAAVLPAGLLILCEFLRLCGATCFSVSTRGLRYGLVDALATGDAEPTWKW